MTDLKPLPVEGYTTQSQNNVDKVNAFKIKEEEILRMIDNLIGHDEDGRWLSIGRTHIQQGFMAINRSIFKPQRIKLLNDGESA